VETIAALKQGLAPKVVIWVQVVPSHDQVSPRGTREMATKQDYAFVHQVEDHRVLQGKTETNAGGIPLV
jgi:hypothetical protein